MTTITWFDSMAKSSRLDGDGIDFVSIVFLIANNTPSPLDILSFL